MPNIMKYLTVPGAHLSHLGHILEDVKWLYSGLGWMEVRWIGHVVNLVAHSLARYARNVLDYVIWIEDFPPPALEAFYLDSIQFQELMNEIFFLKKKKPLIQLKL